MVTIVAIRPIKSEKGQSYIETLTQAFESDYMELEDMNGLPEDDKQVVIFHPRKYDDNPDWLTPEKVENFNDFDFPEVAYYVFNSDYDSDIIQDISDNFPPLKDKARWVRIPTVKWERGGFTSIHAQTACAIVLWERWKKLGKNVE